MYYYDIDNRVCIFLHLVNLHTCFKIYLGKYEKLVFCFYRRILTTHYYTGKPALKGWAIGGLTLRKI